MANGPRPFPNDDLSWKNMKDRLYISLTSPGKFFYLGIIAATTNCLGASWPLILAVVGLNYTFFPAFSPLMDYVLDNMCFRLIFGVPLLPVLVGLPDGTGYSLTFAIGIYILIFFTDCLILSGKYLFKYFYSRRSKGKEVDGRGEVDP